MTENYEVIDTDTLRISRSEVVVKAQLQDALTQLNSTIAREKAQIDDKYAEHLTRLNLLLSQWG